LNRYTYVLNNPLRYVDPTGHDGIEFTLTLSKEAWEALRDLLRQGATNAREVGDAAGAAVGTLGEVATGLAAAPFKGAQLAVVAATGTTESVAFGAGVRELAGAAGARELENMVTDLDVLANAHDGLKLTISMNSSGEFAQNVTIVAYDMEPITLSSEGNSASDIFMMAFNRFQYLARVQGSFWDQNTPQTTQIAIENVITWK
jgi:hypothetical protein